MAAARRQAEHAKYKAEATAWQRVENSYKGGIPTRTSEGWTMADGQRFGNMADRQQLMSARDRAYQAYKNNPVARTLIQTETDNVIGDGLNYQPTTDSPAWNREAKDRYYEWIEECSVRGPDIHSGCEFQRMLWEQSRVAGDVGWILVSRDYIDPSSGVLIIDSKLQMVPAENIATPDGMNIDKAVYDGIRFDSAGRPTTFYVLYKDDISQRRRFATVAARDFRYLPHFSLPNQARGETCFITVFDTLSHLDRYIDGVSLAAWMATVFGIIFKETNAARQHQTLPGLLPDSQGTERRAITLEGPMVKYMAPEGEIVQVDAKQPMSQTPEFIRQMFRIIGQPFDMPLEVLARDMSTVNFASARIGLLPFYRSCRIRATRFASRWRRTIQWWLSREKNRSSGDPKRWKTAFPENYWNHDLLTNEWDYTDPVSEAQADQLQIDMGIKSRKMVIAERGRDMEQIDRDLDADKRPEVKSTMTRDVVPVTAAAPMPGGRMREPAGEGANGNGAA